MGMSGGYFQIHFQAGTAQTRQVLLAQYKITRFCLIDYIKGNKPV